MRFYDAVCQSSEYHSMDCHLNATDQFSACDISRPLKHSFIHTGHGSIDPEQSWGNPETIDE